MKNKNWINLISESYIKQCRINEGMNDAPSTPIPPLRTRFSDHTREPHQDHHFDLMVQHNERLMAAHTPGVPPDRKAIARGQELLRAAESAGHKGLVVDSGGFISDRHTQVRYDGEEDTFPSPIHRRTRASTGQDGTHTYYGTYDNPFYGH